MPRPRLSARRAVRSACRRRGLEREQDHIRRRENFAMIPTRRCGDDPSPDPRGSACFVRADGQRNLGQGLALQAKRGRGDEERRKAAANTLRRRSIKPWPIAWARHPALAKPRSSASFETARLPPATFPVLISYSLAYYHHSNMSRGKSGVADG